MHQVSEATSVASGTSYTLMSLKAFGDLVIARTSLAAAPAGTGLAIAHHLLELNEALRPGPAPQIVKHDERGVPAVFDLRRRGLWRGILSAAGLRQAVRRSGIAATDTLVFDQIGPRERFISRGQSIRALPKRPNVYLAYAELLNGKHDIVPRIGNGLQTVGIFPSSRIAAKNLPVAAVVRLAERCRDAGILPRVFLLAGERPELEAAFTDATIVPRRFAAMAEAVRDAGAIISADSLPAHLAEHWQRPVFVVSPVDNRYWLPLSAYEHDRWTLFERINDERLTTFLAVCAATATAAARTVAAS